MTQTNVIHDLEAASSLLKAMSNEHRLMILCKLVDGEKTVTELENLLGLRQTTLSQHLARLRYVGLVKTRREAQSIHYSISDSQCKPILDMIHDLYCTKPIAA